MTNGEADRVRACIGCAEPGAGLYCTTTGANPGRKLRLCERCLRNGEWYEFGLVERAAKGTRLGNIRSDGSSAVELVVLDLDGDPIDREPPRCPYGGRGDMLWVKETFCWLTGNGQRPWYRADGDTPLSLDGSSVIGTPKWTPSIYMPRDESRISLEVTRTRAERLQDITGADIVAEGAVERPHQDPNLGRCPVSAFDRCVYPDLISLWAAGWDRINGKLAP